MTLHRHALSVLVLFVGAGMLAPVLSPAEGKARFRSGKHNTVNGQRHSYRVVVDNGPTNGVASVALSLSSDGGREDLSLTESDAWLHGSAALSALPATEAGLTLTLYDQISASLMTFSGTLGADGLVALTADVKRDTSSGTCGATSRTGCTPSPGDESATAQDVEVLAVEVFAASGGYELVLDLAGADTYDVAYATLSWTERDEVTTCDRANGCTTTGSSTTMTAEVDWETVGSVWEAESTLEHSGVVDVKAKALDAAGNTVENARAELAEPWGDDGEGVNALSAGRGTSVALTEYDVCSLGRCSSHPGMTVVSDGWTTTSYPTHAELVVAGGDTVTVPANSYHRSHRVFGMGGILDSPRLAGDATLSITAASIRMEHLSVSELSTAVCSSGTCVVLVEGEEGYELSFTAYGTNPGELPDEQDFLVVLYDEAGTEVASETVSVAFDAEVAAVFASELMIEGDPIGADASGSVKLLGAADNRGKRATLSKGTFYGSFSRDSDGDLSLDGYGPDDWATSDISANVLLGDPVECGGAGCDGDWVPPVIVYGNGSGTKNAASQASAKPELL